MGLEIGFEAQPQQSAQPSASQDIDASTRRFAVFAAAAGLSTWAIDMAATHVGLPSMQAALGISVTASQWILNVTLIILAGVVTLAGALGDRIGRMRIFRLGTLLIVVGATISFAGGLLNFFGVLVLGRAIDGLGAACSIPAATAMLLDVFPIAERGAAQGRMLAISMSVTALAPTAIGVVIQVLSWPYAYLMTVLGAVVTWLLIGRVTYIQAEPQATSFDYTGGLLVFLSVALLTTGIMQVGESGPTSPTVLLLVGAGLTSSVVLVVVALRKPNPLIQFRLMKIRNVGIAVFVTLMRFLPMVLMGVFVARYVQQVLGLSPTLTGLLMIPPILAQVGGAPIAGNMLDKGGSRAPVSLGLGLLLGGLVFLASGFPAKDIWLVSISTILGGASFSLTNPVQMSALNGVPPEQRGMLAGVFPLAGQFGTAFWVALSTAALSSMMADIMSYNPEATEATAQADALGELSWIGVGLTLATLSISLMLRNAPRQSLPSSADYNP